MAKSICHMTCAHDVDDVRVFQKECVSLAVAGYDVTLLAPCNGSCERSGVKIVGVPYRSKNPLYRVLVLARRVYKEAVRLDADLYHFHDIELFWYGLKLKRKGKIVVFDSHEDWPQYVLDIAWLPQFAKRWLSAYLTKSYQKELDKFDAVVTVSPNIAQSMNALASIEAVVVTNYPREFVEHVEVVENYVKRSNCLCYAGTVYRFGNQEHIIRAIQDLDISYRIVGSIDNDFKRYLESLDVNGKVEFVDFAPRSELYRIYADSTIAICVFDYMNNTGGRVGTLGGNKIFEYMAMGLPIICTDFELWKDLIVDKYNCGVCVSPRSEVQLKAALERLISDKRAAYRMGQNGQEAVRIEFNWKTQERVLLDLYNRLLNDETL